MTLLCLPPGPNLTTILQRQSLPEVFADPFRMPATALAQAAARDLQQQLVVKLPGAALAEGKMFGVLVVRQGTTISYLQACSGQALASWQQSGFVPALVSVERLQSLQEPVAQQLSLLEREIAEWQQQRTPLLRQAERLQHQQRQAEHALRLAHKKRKRERAQQRQQLSQMPSGEGLRNRPSQGMQTPTPSMKTASSQSSLATSTSTPGGGALLPSTRSRTQESGSDTATDSAFAELATASQRDRRQRKQQRRDHQQQLQPLQDHIGRIDANLQVLKRRRQHVSATAQQRIFSAYQVVNALGNVTTLDALLHGPARISGAGDCAAPKLVQYAYRNGLQPLALAEFWWGPSPASGVRHQGQLYPPCRGKCGVVLPYMLGGLQGFPVLTAEGKTDPQTVNSATNAAAPHPPPMMDVGFAQAVHGIRHQVESRRQAEAAAAVAVADLEIVFEDSDIIAINKPCGLLSVPGKGKELSALELVEQYLQQSATQCATDESSKAQLQTVCTSASERDAPSCRALTPADAVARPPAAALVVHRLDMDTSGLLLLAKNAPAQRHLQRQFESRKTRKEYVAVVEGRPATTNGLVTLPLRVDLDDRPRQLVCHSHGKAAVTRWQIDGEHDASINVADASGGRGNTDTAAGMTTDTTAADAMTADAMTADVMTADVMTADVMTADVMTADVMTADVMTADVMTADVMTADAMAADVMTADVMTADVMTADAMTADAMTADTMTADTMTADAVTADAVTADAVTADAVTADAVTADVMTADAMTADAMTEDTMTADAMTADAMTADAVTADAMTADAMTADAMTADAMTADAITADVMTADVMTADAMTADAMTEDTMTADAITADAMAADAMTADAMTADAITADAMTADAMTADAMTADAMTADAMTADAMTADAITADAMTADAITADAMTADAMTADAMTADVISAEAMTSGVTTLDAAVTDPVTTELIVGVERSDAPNAQSVRAVSVSAAASADNPDSTPPRTVSSVVAPSQSTLSPASVADSMTTRLRLFPLTGRSHQLRVHCAHPAGLACPIQGDRLYGYRDVEPMVAGGAQSGATTAGEGAGQNGSRMLLHAHRLRFRHPRSMQWMTLEARLPF